MKIQHPSSVTARTFFSDLRSCMRLPRSLRFALLLAFPLAVICFVYFPRTPIYAKAITCSRTSTTGKYTYATFIATPEYLTGLHALLCSLRLVGTRYPVLVAVSADMNNSVVSYLKQNGLEDGVNVTVIEAIQGPADVEHERFNFNWSKLRLWAMEEYDRVFFLDADTVVVQNVDGLFGLPPEIQFAAVSSRSYSFSRGLNGGVFLVRPCVEVFEDIMKHLYDDYDRQLAEQALLNYYCGVDITWLPQRYNVRYNSDSESQSEESVADIRILHFAGEFEKPWHAHPKNRLWAGLPYWSRARYGCNVSTPSGAALGTLA